MKTLASASFFRTFDLLLAAGNPGLKLSHWNQDGVAWERERHSFNTRAYGFALEIATLTHSGRQGWSLIVVKEFWWTGDRDKGVRSTHWAHLLSGRRDAAIGWMREQEKMLERELAS
jgi:hypothetical protein